MLALVMGCRSGGDGVVAPTPASLAGTWKLTTVNGAGLPYTLRAANPKVELLGDRWQIAAGGTFTQLTTLRTTSLTGVVNTVEAPDTGTWTMSGTAVTLRYSDLSTDTGTLSGNTITVAQAGYSAVYVKQ
jgi:hypothetical protein